MGSNPNHINGTGNALANTITGNSGNNTINGGDQNDIIRGGIGADTLNGEGGDDTVFYESADGNIDSQDGGEGTDTIDGAGVNFGDVRFDLLAGRYSSPNGSSESWLNFENYRNLSASGSETVFGTNGANIITTGGGANIIVGGAGADQLNGGGGIDNMSGGTGSDTYFADVFNDIVFEGTADLIGGGNDLVNYSGTGTFTLSMNVERLTLTHASANVNGTGNELLNTIIGNAGANILNGGADSLTDILQGELGNDTYVLGAGSDTVNESGGNAGGIDTVTSTITRALSAGGLLSVENLIMLGAGTATGNALNNTLDGSQFAGVNALIGGLGNDTYVLGAGSDTVTEAAGTSGGIDTATSTIARSLSVGGLVNVENLIMLGAGTGTGNAAVNTLDGSKFAGANLLRGMANNDTYIIGAGDTVDETIAGSAAPTPSAR